MLAISEGGGLHGAPRRLLLSIHDVSPRFEGEVDRLRDFLGRHAPAGKIALLVVPNHWGTAPILPGSPFAARLRLWAGLGAEIFLHGWSHHDDSTHQSGAARLKARHMTAGEGEFLGLPRDEALSRIFHGRALIENITGTPIAGFIAPAWLYGAGAREALTESGVTLAEDHWTVWNPATGHALSKGPVLTWASRSPIRIRSSLLAARILPPILRRSRTARIGVHPGDTTVPALMRSIDRAVSDLARTHRPARYADLLVDA